MTNSDKVYESFGAAKKIKCVLKTFGDRVYMETIMYCIVAHSTYSSVFGTFKIM